MKKICVVTGTRAEYGLLNPLVRMIEEDSELSLQLIVTGAHLSERMGLTYREIEEDGHFIDHKIDMELADDTPRGILTSMSIALSGFAKQFDIAKPDLIILLGDRYETLIAAIASTVSLIPIAHIHGGELTEGAIDDAFRHAITKMSALHFTSTEDYRRRVIQLGEQPNKVFNVGALGVEIMKNLEILPKAYISEKIGFPIDKNTILVTFHPVTLEGNTSGNQFNELINALDEIHNIKVIFTKANADANGQIINNTIDNYVQKNPYKAMSFTSMGQKLYLSAMNYCGAVVGNSSSGIIEAPSFFVPTVNIGDRQKGRIQATSIINCKPEKEDILHAMEKALNLNLSNKDTFKNPYDGGCTHKQIIECIKDQLINDKITLKKSFYDIGWMNQQ